MRKAIKRYLRMLLLLVVVVLLCGCVVQAPQIKSLKQIMMEEQSRAVQ